VIRNDQVAAAGPVKTDPRSGKHKYHGGNVQVIAAPGRLAPVGLPVHPGCGHDITCARAHGLAAVLGIPTLTDPGYENTGVHQGLTGLPEVSAQDRKQKPICQDFEGRSPRPIRLMALTRFSTRI
jgi:hypothetical protein